MDRRETLFNLDNLGLFVASYDGCLWLEIKDAFLEAEFNGHDYVRLNLESISSDELLTLAYSLIKYVEGEQSIE